MHSWRESGILIPFDGLKKYIRDGSERQRALSKATRLAGSRRWLGPRGLVSYPEQLLHSQSWTSVSN